MLFQDLRIGLCCLLHDSDAFNCPARRKDCLQSISCRVVKAFSCMRDALFATACKPGDVPSDALSINSGHREQLLFAFLHFLFGTNMVAGYNSSLRRLLRFIPFQSAPYSFGLQTLPPAFNIQLNLPATTDASSGQQLPLQNQLSPFSSYKHSMHCPVLYPFPTLDNQPATQQYHT